MIHDLKQFVPSEVCLSCDGCCRFKEADSAWRPKVSGREIKAAKQSDLFLKIYTKERVDSTERVKTVSCEGHNFCSFLDQKTNACRVYDQRPFECRLYPFVLTKKENKTVVTAHHHCPFVQQKRQTREFNDYAKYLEGFFKTKGVLDFVKENSGAWEEYPDDQDQLEYLFDIC